MEKDNGIRKEIDRELNKWCRQKQGDWIFPRNVPEKQRDTDLNRRWFIGLDE
jgi:hypothetical protein